MQQPMHNVKSQLLPEGTSKPSRMIARPLGAEKNLAVLKRQDVGWSRLFQELSM